MVEAARNVACTGAMPRAVTDGLNFGSPQVPHVYWQFSEAVRGIADAAETMETPVVSGNVSFYNESELGEVPPTPLIGMLGVLEDAECRVGIAPPGEAELWLLSTPSATPEHGGLGASAFLWEIHGREDGYPAAPDVVAERRLCEALVRGVSEGVIVSAHDCSEGGIAVALAEVALASKLGVEAAIQEEGLLRLDARLYGEMPGRVIVGTHDAVRLQQVVTEPGLGVRRLGRIGGESGLRLAAGPGTCMVWTLKELAEAYEGSIPRIIGQNRKLVGERGL